MKKLLAMIAVIGFACVSFAQDKPAVPAPAQPAAAPSAKAKDTLPRITVMPFKLSAGFEEKIDIKGSNANAVTTIDRSLINREISSRLVVFLDRSRRFTVLNREDLKEVIDENKLIDSDHVAPGQDSKVNKLQISDLIVTGTISRLEITGKPTDIALTGEHSMRVTGVFKVQFAVTDVKSGKVLYSNQIEQRMQPEDYRSSVPASERKDWNIRDYYSFLFERTANRIGNSIINAIYPIKIADINGDIVTLNRGEGAGLAVGTVIQVYTVGETITDPDTNEVIGTSETPVAKLEVTQLESKLSRAKITEKGKLELTRGMVCRPLTDEDLRNMRNAENASKANPVPSATDGW